MPNQNEFGTWHSALGAFLAAPLATLAVAFCAGIACESRLNWSGWLYITVTAVLLVGWLICRSREWPMPLRWALLLALAFVLGGWRMGLDRHALEPNHIANELRPDGEIVTLRGQVETRPVVHPHALANFPGALPHDPTCTFLLRVSAIRHWRGEGLSDQLWQPASGLVSVQCSGPALQIEPGQSFQRNGFLEPARPAANPGGEELARMNLDNRLFATFWLPTERDEEVPAEAPAQVATGWRAAHDWLRLKAHGLLLGQAEPLDYEDQVLLDNVVLGHRGEAAEQVAGPFMRTGTYHFLAISGLHMAILAGVTWLLLRLLRVRPRRSALIVLLIVASYCLMAEARPPILRAGIMIGLVCGGLIVQRETHAVNLLATAAIILLALGPGELFGAGFQLSFVVVLGLVLFTSPFYQWVYRLVAGRPPDADADHPSFDWLAGHPLADRLLRFVLQMFAVSAVAWIVGLPLTAYYFYRFYPWSIVSSIALWVPIWLALSLSYLKMLISVPLPGLGAWLNGPLHTAAGVVLATVRGLDRLPGMSVTVARPGALLIVLFYSYLALWKFRPRWLTARWMLIIGLSGAIVITLSKPPPADRMELTVLAVEDGLCQVVRLPDGRTMIFDCGSLEAQDVGEQVVVPFLAEGGPGGPGGGAEPAGWPWPMPAVCGFISHAHIDHYGGFPNLARRGLLTELIVSPALLAEAAGRPPPSANSKLRPMESVAPAAWQPDSDGPLPTGDPPPSRRQSQQELTARLTRLLGEQGAPLRSVSGGAVFRLGQVDAEVLWPPQWIEQILGPKSTNDTSLVIRLKFAGRTVLLTGDIDTFAERRLLDGQAAGQIDLRSDVLSMPHHGAITPTTDQFIRAVDPQLVIISTRRKADKIVPRCPALCGRAVLLTSQSGAVTVRIDAGIEEPGQGGQDEQACRPDLGRGRLTWHEHLDGDW